MQHVTELKISSEAVAAVSAARNILVINVLAVMCGLAVVVFACVATNGLDTSAGFF